MCWGDLARANRSFGPHTSKNRIPPSSLTLTKLRWNKFSPPFRECADVIGEQQKRKSLPESTTFRSQNSRICPSAITLLLARTFWQSDLIRRPENDVDRTITLPPVIRL